MAIYGLKYYEADQEGYYRLYYRRKPWARITPLPNEVYYNPPSMALWQYTPGRNVLLCDRKRFKWWTIHKAATEGWSKWVE